MGDTKFSNLRFSGRNPKVLPFIGTLLSGTLPLWRCLFVLDLALSEVKGLIIFLQIYADATLVFPLLVAETFARNFKTDN